MSAEREVSKGVTVHPGRCGGQPCMAGTRVSADMLANLLSGEDPCNPDYLVETYPSLTYYDIANVRGWMRKGRPS